MSKGGKDVDLLECWLEQLLQDPAGNDKVFDWVAPVNTIRFESRLKRLEKVRAMEFKGSTKAARRNRGRKSNLVGRLFEHLIAGLLIDCRALSYKERLRSTTGEIDFLMSVEPLGAAVPMLRLAGTHAIGEAKCHQSAPKSEWVNELRGILETHGTSLGFLFVGCKPRKLRADVRQAIALHNQNKRHVVPIGMKQLYEIRAGGNFLRIFADQYALSQVHSSSIEV